MADALAATSGAAGDRQVAAASRAALTNGAIMPKWWVTGTVRLTGELDTIQVDADTSDQAMKAAGESMMISSVSPVDSPPQPILDYASPGRKPAPLPVAGPPGPVSMSAASRSRAFRADHPNGLFWHERLEIVLLRLLAAVAYLVGTVSFFLHDDGAKELANTIRSVGAFTAGAVWHIGVIIITSRGANRLRFT